MKTKINLRKTISTLSWPTYWIRAFLLVLGALTLLATASFAQMAVGATTEGSGLIPYTPLGFLFTANTTADTNPANDRVTGGTALHGSYDVPGDFPSLTNPGGIFEALNTAGASDDVIIDIAEDLNGETGTVALNQVDSTSVDIEIKIRIRIKRDRPTTTISGTGDRPHVIKLNGADNVTIDGSLTSGADRSLTITNGNTGGTVIWIASASAADGAKGNTIKNCILGGSASTAIFSGILAGSGTTFGGAAEAPNSNNTIQNNQIFRVENAAFVSGNAGTLDQNWLITGNSFGSTTVADKLTSRGVFLGNARDFTISNNIINGVSSATTASSTISGIQIASLLNGGSVSGNKITDIKQNNPAGFGANGIYLTSTSTAANVTVANNAISDVTGQGSDGIADVNNGYGIVAVSGGGYNLYHNSILLNTNQVAATGITGGINISSGVTTPGAIDLRDNIVANTQTVGTRYGIISSAPATVFSNINYNDYFAQSVGFIGGSARATLANWQAATAQDANSLATDPLFVTSSAPADLHVAPESPVINAGTPVGIFNDIDGNPRGPLPDLGADEFAATQSINVATRLRVQTGDNVGIGGFIVTGSAPKDVIIRAIGPSLTKLGVPDALADPVLELHGPGGFGTIVNNNWRDTQEAAIQATGIPPTNNLESAINATLVPGAYTAVVRGNGNTSGVALVEIYDLNPAAASKLANLSTRAFVSTGDNIVIAGFVIDGGCIPPFCPRPMGCHPPWLCDPIIIRGLGGSLATAGVPNALANPTLELRDSNGALLVANNDWQDDPAQAAELSAAGLAPTNQLESGIAATLPPGLYTALLAGLNNGTGVGLVEVYDLARTP